MRKYNVFLLAMLSACGALLAQNPFIRDQFTADPTARVFEGRVYVYPSHDIPSPIERLKEWFCMADYHVFSSDNLTDWTDHGVIVSQDKVPWVDPGSYSMWAPDCVYRNGKYYFYFPASVKDTLTGRGSMVGVAIAGHPEGPYVPQPEPIRGIHGIDPCTLTDHDGQAYIYWAGFGNLMGARLKDNMLELDSEPVVIRGLPEADKGLKEGPFVFERNGQYYFTFPWVQDSTESLVYAVGDHPLGPFEMKGVIMDQSPTGCWTNHHSIIEYRDQWYLFYHHNDLSPQFDKNRSIRVDSLFFNPDGSIRKVIPTLRGVGISDARKEIHVDRYSRLSDKGAAIGFVNDANTFEGWKTILNTAGAWVQYNRVDFGNEELKTAEARIASPKGGKIKVRTDGADGTVIAEIQAPQSNAWTNVNVPLGAIPSGVRDLFITLEGNAPVEIDWIRFGEALADRHSADAMFVNPVIYADVPDPDVIRVGNEFYMVSTTMHLMPGAPIMKSKDLVNWEITGYVFDEIKDSPLYDLEGGNVYGQGQWASSLRYHDGTFYVFFATNNPEKSYLYATANPSGRWERISVQEGNYHDASLLFDDDGKVYLAYGSGHIRIAEVNSGPDGLKNAPGVGVINGEELGYHGLLEGSHFCKYNGKYYLFLIWWPPGGIRTQLCFRSDRPYGTYESKVILSDTLDLYGRGVAQGCIVDTEDGRWFGFLFQDHNAVGRVPVLMPCRWEDGWPLLGDKDGKAPKVMEKPVQGYAATPLVAGDNFDAMQLALNWQWNHNPDNSLWSLAERPGYLRLRTGKIVQSIFEARNTLSQRTEGPRCSGILAMDVSQMKNGDVAGLGTFCSEPGLISVVMENGGKFIVMTDRGEEKARAPLTENTIYLHIDCDFNTDKANFYYSLNSQNRTPIGPEFQMIYNLAHFMGNRLAIYNYATKTTGGYVDVDFFNYTKQQ